MKRKDAAVLSHEKKKVEVVEEDERGEEKGD